MTEKMQRVDNPARPATHRAGPPAGHTMPRATKEDLVLETSLALFATHGYHAVGVDRIKEASGVAKMTLYKHLANYMNLSKKHLILHTLMPIKITTQTIMNTSMN